ncbi:tyrosine-type recombinase/integrase [Desulfitibacter alkalitolerans]|uniref:tyrosine-type recombinase/integrase n=1 Tax=Desulfitibacter alkalitolerans TaxID=264641 RepID=UPI000684CEC6|nr:tyrosine-type recombinase/integrase [Desulfitibacter alkalitolerans]
MQSQLITNGIDAVMKFCKDFRSRETVRKYTKACEFIQKYYHQQQHINYCADINEEIRQGLHLEISVNQTFKYNRERYVFRVLGMLDGYYKGLPIHYKYPIMSRYKHQLEPFYEFIAEDFKGSLTVKKSTVPILYSIARDFFYYLQQLKISDLRTIHQETIYDFLMQEYKDHRGCMHNVMYVVRLICKHLHNKGFHNMPTELLPFALAPSMKKVLPSFNRTDMERVLLSPDTKTHAGKRDYAILMLASVTGIRAIDIANLKLTDINWMEMTIHFVQHKTGYGLSLPFDSSAAAAVADYILNGRPDIESPYVFLTEAAPYRKLSDKSSVSNILNKHIKVAGIEKKAYDGKSFHAFRRSMGVWLLDTSSSPEMISQILGHRGKGVLKRYLPLEASKLNICALGFDAIPVQSEVYR